MTFRESAPQRAFVLPVIVLLLAAVSSRADQPPQRLQSGVKPTARPAPDTPPAPLDVRYKCCNYYGTRASCRSPYSELGEVRAAQTRHEAAASCRRLKYSHFLTEDGIIHFVRSPEWMDFGYFNLQCDATGVRRYAFETVRISDDANVIRTIDISYTENQISDILITDRDADGTAFLRIPIKDGKGVDRIFTGEDGEVVHLGLNQRVYPSLTAIIKSLVHTNHEVVEECCESRACRDERAGDRIGTLGPHGQR